MFDWADLAFASKKPLRSLNATFIAAPRELGQKRFAQLVKQYLPKGNIVVGIAKERYVDGFNGQRQFRTLQQSDIQLIVDKVNASDVTHKIYLLSYFQRELSFIIEKIVPPNAVFVNGSWKYSFHTLPIYYTLVNCKVNFELVSPFADLDEAIDYTTTIASEITFPIPTKDLTAPEMLGLAETAAVESFDYGFQTGVILAKNIGTKYRYLTHGCNRVVPFQGYALHNGASRESHFSPPNDLNHYDTIHAEMDMLVKAQKNKIDLRDTTLFINLMPCPTCSRVLAATDISQYFYRMEHSDNYAGKLLELCGKTIKRIV